MNRITGFAVGLAIALIGVVAMVMFVFQPEGKDVPLFVVLVSTPLVIAIGGAILAQRWLLWRRFNRLAVAMFIVYAIGAGLILLTMFVTTQLMFISAHDATLATVIVIYATGVTLVFGYFVVSGLTDSIDKLTLAAREVQRGNLSARADDRGRDEVAQLARTFNGMTVQLAAAREKKGNWMLRGETGSHGCRTTCAHRSPAFARAPRRWLMAWLRNPRTCRLTSTPSAMTPAR